MEVAAWEKPGRLSKGQGHSSGRGIEMYRVQKFKMTVGKEVFVGLLQFHFHILILAPFETFCACGLKWGCSYCFSKWLTSDSGIVFK